MPTGYTNIISKGVSFRQFALQCARAFGACVHQRDEDGDSPPREREVSHYHEKELEKSKAELVRLRSLTAGEIEAECSAKFVQDLAQYYSSLKKNSSLKVKYETMLAEVVAWNPPTAEHEGMKKFMVEQITESIRFDTGYPTGYPTNKPEKMYPGEWFVERISYCILDIEYHEEEFAKEKERVAKSNQWLRDLMGSL